MPTLHWIGKDAVVHHHAEVPFHLLRCDDALSVGAPGSGNLLVQGDNLTALKALLPYYAGKVKCIYIDPPYNTGNEGWSYNDNVNSPEIRAWLGAVVGKEAEDLSRHDKWLSMMYPRLTLLRELLRNDGVIFVSIDDIEVSNLRLVLDELFGRSNFVGTIIWKNATDNNPTKIAVEHEYVICYARNIQNVQPEWKSVTIDTKTKILEVGQQFVSEFTDSQQRQEQYTTWFRENRPFLWPFQDYKFIDEYGIYTGMRSVHNPGKEGYRYDVIHPKTGKPCRQPMMGYRYPEDTMNELIRQGRIIFGDDETKIIELKVYASDYRAKLSSLFELDGRRGTNEIKSIFPEDRRPFDFPKPTGLIEELLSFTTTEQDIILDSFAGSGTTGQAVLQINSIDGGQRKFVLVEMDQSISDEITRHRLQRVCNGYKDKSGESINGLGGGFRYCRLGPTLFDAEGQIRADVSYSELARHVFFSETGEPLSGEPLQPPLVGIHKESAVYLLFNGVMGDARPDGGNLLTRETLAGLPAHTGPSIIYAEGCALTPDYLSRRRITFRQTPYQIRVR